MKAISQPLQAFIADFKLEHQDHIICFEAIIYFSSNNNFIQLPTSVQIITIAGTGLDVLYLLDIDIKKHGIPDTYPIGKNSFEYIKNNALVIKGEYPTHGHFILSIHPGSNRCEEETLNEIHQRTYN